MKHFIKYIAGFSIAVFFGLFILSITHHLWIKQKLRGHEDLALVVTDSIIEPIESLPQMESLPQIVDEVITNHVECLQEDDNIILTNTESVESPEKAMTDGSHFRNDLMVVNTGSDSLSLYRMKKKLERLQNVWNTFQILDVHLNNIQQLSKEEKKKEGKGSAR